MEVDPGGPRTELDKLTQQSGQVAGASVTPTAPWMKTSLRGKGGAVEFSRTASGSGPRLRRVHRGRQVRRALHRHQGMTVVDNIKAIILDAMPGATFTVTTTASNVINTPATWDRERAEALDHLADLIGCEWMASVDGTFHIDPLPALVESAAEWIVDAGDVGVTITHVTSLDRAAVYNAVVVNEEPPDGTARPMAWPTTPTLPVMWGGPFGKVPSSTPPVHHHQRTGTGHRPVHAGRHVTCSRSLGHPSPPPTTRGHCGLRQRQDRHRLGQVVLRQTMTAVGSGTPMGLTLRMALQTDRRRPGTSRRCRLGQCPAAPTQGVFVEGSDGHSPHEHDGRGHHGGDQAGSDQHRLVASARSPRSTGLRLGGRGHLPRRRSSRLRSTTWWRCDDRDA